MKTFIVKERYIFSLLVFINVILYPTHFARVSTINRVLLTLM